MRKKIIVKARPAHRPTMYRSDYAEQARKLCLLGYTDEELASFFNVTVTTLNVWKNKHPKFVAAIKAGKAIIDAEVAASLLHRAMGYSHEAVKIMQAEGSSYEHKYIEHYPPDTTAGIFWLKNRQPAYWRDKIQSEVTGKDGGPILLKHTPEDIAAAADLAKKLNDVTA
jgi:hypothetical protein